MKATTKDIELDNLELERRRIHRRNRADRRLAERRKKYWWSVIFPIIIGVCVTALISWGAYVTHVTYTISANYETSFVRHVNNQVKKDAALELKIEMLRTDYTHKMNSMRADMNSGLKEIREANNRIYNLLIGRDDGKQEQ